MSDTNAAMVIDPVCKMTLDPARAAAQDVHDGKTVYFCSESCHRRFMENPNSYVLVAVAVGTNGSLACHSAGHHGQAMARAGTRLRAVVAGVLAVVALLGFYFVVLTLVSGWEFTSDQFVEFWPYIVSLALGFGIQVGLFSYLRQAMHGGSGKVVAATGTTSGTVMVACCSHYLVNLLPALGATGLMAFVGQYQIELFWFAIAANLAGVLYIGQRVLGFAKEA